MTLYLLTYPPGVKIVDSSGIIAPYHWLYQPQSLGITSIGGLYNPRKRVLDVSDVRMPIFGVTIWDLQVHMFVPYQIVDQHFATPRITLQPCKILATSDSRNCLILMVVCSFGTTRKHWKQVTVLANNLPQPEFSFERRLSALTRRH